jgi:hypothetical protein
MIRIHNDKTVTNWLRSFHHPGGLLPFTNGSKFEITEAQANTLMKRMGDQIPVFDGERLGELNPELDQYQTFDRVVTMIRKRVNYGPILTFGFWPRTVPDMIRGAPTFEKCGLVQLGGYIENGPGRYTHGRFWPTAMKNMSAMLWESRMWRQILPNTPQAMWVSDRYIFADKDTHDLKPGEQNFPKYVTNEDFQLYKEVMYTVGGVIYWNPVTDQDDLRFLGV